MKYPYDLSPYKLTLPTDKAGKLSGKAAEIMKLNGYESPYFRLTDSGLLFTCPDAGATTPNAKYPRSELRDLREFGSDTNIEDKVKFKVLSCPVGAKVVVHQIHDDVAARVKVVWLQKDALTGRLYALVKAGSKDITVPLLDEIKNAQSVVSYIKYSYGRLTLKANKSTEHLAVSWELQGAYFKRGNYFQSNANKGFVCSVLHMKV